MRRCIWAEKPKITDWMKRRGGLQRKPKIITARPRYILMYI